MSKSKTRKARTHAEREPVPPADSARPPGEEAAGSPQHPREGSKQALLIQLLSRPKGASLDDLVGATGWLPHTTRAALTGLRRRGFAIERVPADGARSLYRVAAAEAEKPAKNPGRRRGTAKAEAQATG
jgi:hypothetical protein